MSKVSIRIELIHSYQLNSEIIIFYGAASCFINSVVIY